MTTKTDNSGQIVPKKQVTNSLAGLLQKMGPELSKALPKHVDPDRMARIALTALRTNPKLQKCSSGSFLGSVLSAAQLGLEPNTPLGHAYLIPYKTECTLQIGYQGMIDLVRRTKSVTDIYAEVVYEGDEFEVKLGLHRDITHIPSKKEDREDGKITHVYAVAHMKDGGATFVVLTAKQVEKFRRRSRASSSGPWVTDYEAMAKKTAVRRLFTWLPKSAEMARAVAVDEAPEIGAQQSDAWDPDVQNALEAQGVEVTREPGDDSDIEEGA